MKNYQDTEELGDFGRLLVDTSVKNAEREIIEQGETVSVGASIPRPRFEPKTVLDVIMPRPKQTLVPKQPPIEEQVEEVLVQQEAPTPTLTPEQIAQIKGQVSTDEVQTRGVVLKSTTEPVVPEKGLPMMAKVAIGLGFAAFVGAVIYYVSKPSKVKTSQKPSEKTEKELEGIRKRKVAAKKKYALQGLQK